MQRNKYLIQKQGSMQTEKAFTLIGQQCIPASKWSLFIESRPDLSLQLNDNSACKRFNLMRSVTMRGWL